MRIQKSDSRITPFTRAIAVLTVAIFLTMDLCGHLPAAFANPPAANIPREEISGASSALIPAEFGRVEEIYSGSPGAKTVFFVQDAHDSLEAQENISKIVGHLVGARGVRTVFEEGYEGPVPTDKYFGFIKDPALKQKVAYFFLDHLRIGGAEYAHINRAKDFDLVGADSIKLHKENIRQYRLSVGQQEAITKDLKALETEVRSMARRRFSRELLEWIKIKERFDAKKIDLLDYLGRTMKLLAQKNALSGDRLALARFLLDARSSHDPVVAEKIKRIDAREIYTELLKLEGAMSETYLTDTVDRELFGYCKVLGLLNRLNDLQITQEEFEAVQTTLKIFNTEALGLFIHRNIRKPLVLSRQWERNVREAVRFYEIAKERDNSVGRRLDEFMKNSGETAAVLVFGGFHKEDIKRLMESKGLAYRVISPKITKLSQRHQEFYKKLMTVGALPFEQAMLPATATSPERVFSTREGFLEVREVYDTLLANPKADPSILDRYLPTGERASGLKKRSESRTKINDSNDLDQFFASFEGPIYYPAAGTDFYSLSRLAKTFPKLKRLVFSDNFAPWETITPKVIGGSGAIGALPELKLVLDKEFRLKFDKREIRRRGEDLEIDLSYRNDPYEDEDLKGRRFTVRYLIQDLFSVQEQFDAVFVEYPGLGGRLAQNPEFWQRIHSQTKRYLFVGMDTAAPPPELFEKIPDTLITHSNQISCYRSVRSEVRSSDLEVTDIPEELQEKETTIAQFERLLLKEQLDESDLAFVNKLLVFFTFDPRYFPTAKTSVETIREKMKLLLILMRNLDMATFTRAMTLEEECRYKDVGAKLSGQIFAHELSHVRRPYVEIQDFIELFSKAADSQTIAEATKLLNEGQKIGDEFEILDRNLSTFRFHTSARVAAYIVRLLRKYLAAYIPLNERYAAFLKKANPTRTEDAANDHRETISSFHLLGEWAAKGLADFEKYIGGNDLLGYLVIRIAEISVSSADRLAREKPNYLHSAQSISLSKSDMLALVDNLIGNAIEASRKGVPLDLSVRFWTEVQGQKKFLGFSLTDNGAGMDAQTLERVRRGESFTTKRRGSGRGIPGIFDIVRRAGGIVTVSSEVNKGTTFTILLPIFTPGEQAPAAEAEQKSHGSRSEMRSSEAAAGEVLPVVSTGDMGSDVEYFEPLPGESKIAISSDKGVVKSDYYTNMVISQMRKIRERFRERGRTVSKVFEAGTGRGTLAVAASHVFPGAHIVANDLNPEALKLATRNASRNGVPQERFETRTGDAADVLKKGELFDCVILTLPTTIFTPEMAMSEHQKMFLDGGADGRKNIDKFIGTIYPYLSEGAGMYFPISDFVGVEKTLKLLHRNHLQPAALHTIKKYLNETKHTAATADHIRKNLGYEFSKDAGGEYFEIVLIEAVKDGVPSTRSELRDVYGAAIGEREAGDVFTVYFPNETGEKEAYPVFFKTYQDLGQFLTKEEQSALKREIRLHKERLKIALVMPTMDSDSYLPKTVAGVIETASEALKRYPGWKFTIFLTVNGKARAATLQAALKAQRRFIFSGHEIVVLDMGDREGKPAAMNAAAFLAKKRGNEIIGFLDDDIRFSPDAIEGAVSHLVDKGEVFLSGPKPEAEVSSSALERIYEARFAAWQYPHGNSSFLYARTFPFIPEYVRLDDGYLHRYFHKKSWQEGGQRIEKAERGSVYILPQKKLLPYLQRMTGILLGRWQLAEMFRGSGMLSVQQVESPFWWGRILKETSPVEALEIVSTLGVIALWVILVKSRIIFLKFTGHKPKNITYLRDLDTKPGRASEKALRSKPVALRPPRLAQGEDRRSEMRETMELSTRFSNGKPIRIILADLTGTLVTVKRLDTGQIQAEPMPLDLKKELERRLRLGSALIVATGDRFKDAKEWVIDQLSPDVWPYIVVLSQSGMVGHHYETASWKKILDAADFGEGSLQKRNWVRYKDALIQLAKGTAAHFLGDFLTETADSESETTVLKYKRGSIMIRSHQLAFALDKAAIDGDLQVERLKIKAFMTGWITQHEEQFKAWGFEGALAMLSGEQYIDLTFIPGFTKMQGLQNLAEANVLQGILNEREIPWGQALAVGDSLTGNDGLMREFLRAKSPEAMTVSVGEADHKSGKLSSDVRWETGQTGPSGVVFALTPLLEVPAITQSRSEARGEAAIGQEKKVSSARSEVRVGRETYHIGGSVFELELTTDGQLLYRWYQAGKTLAPDEGWEEMPFSKDKNMVTVGRNDPKTGDRNDIAIQDGSVSRRHLEIKRNDDGSFSFRDLGSLNGTFYGGKQYGRKGEPSGYVPLFRQVTVAGTEEPTGVQSLGLGGKNGWVLQVRRMVAGGPLSYRFGLMKEIEKIDPEEWWEEVPEIRPGESVSVGRGQGNDIILPDEPVTKMISRKQLKLSCDDEGCVWFQNLSRNGTFYKDEKYSSKTFGGEEISQNILLFGPVRSEMRAGATASKARGARELTESRRAELENAVFMEWQMRSLINNLKSPTTPEKLSEAVQSLLPFAKAKWITSSQASEIVPILERMPEGGYVETRVWCAELLKIFAETRLIDPSKVSPDISVLKKGLMNENAEVMFLCADALRVLAEGGLIDPSKVFLDIVGLKRKLAEGNAEAQLWCAKALKLLVEGRLIDPSGVSLDISGLQQELMSEDDSRASRRAETLKILTEARLIDPSKTSLEISGLMQRPTAKNAKNRFRALRLLAEAKLIAPSQLPKVISMLVLGLEDGNAEIQYECAGALKALPEAKQITPSQRLKIVAVVSVLTEKLKNENSEGILLRAETLKFLTEAGVIDPSGAPLNISGLLREIRNVNIATLRECARALKFLAESRRISSSDISGIVPSLTEGLMSKDAETMRGCAHALKFLAEAKLIDPSKISIDTSALRQKLKNGYAVTGRRCAEALDFLAEARLISPAEAPEIISALKRELMQEDIATMIWCAETLRHLSETGLFSAVMGVSGLSGEFERTSGKGKWLIAAAYHSLPQYAKEKFYLHLDYLAEYLSVRFQGTNKSSVLWKDIGKAVMALEKNDPAALVLYRQAIEQLFRNDSGKALQLDAIEFYDQGNARDNFPDFMRAMFWMFSTKAPPKPEGLPTVALVSAVDAPDGVLDFGNGESLDLKEPAAKWYGRTRVRSRGNKAYHVKFLKEGEDPSVLVYEHDMLNFLNDRKAAWGLWASYPRGKFRLARVPVGALPDDFRVVRDGEAGAVVLDNHEGYYTVMVYEAELEKDGKNPYEVYLNDVDLAPEEFEEAFVKNVHDRAVLARHGLFDTEIIELFHSREHASRIYDWMLMICPNHRGGEGAGRLDDFVGATLFPNVRLSGPADPAQLRFIDDLVKDSAVRAQADNRLSRLSRMAGRDDDRARSYITAAYLGDMLLSLSLIPPTYLLRRGRAVQDAENLDENYLQKMLTKMFMVVFEAYTGEAMAAAHDGLDLHIPNMAAQMSYFMTSKAAHDFQRGRAIPQVLYPGTAVAPLRKGRGFRNGKWDIREAEYTINSRNPEKVMRMNSQDLGPVNGPNPLQELIRALYIVTPLMVVRRNRRLRDGQQTLQEPVKSGARSEMRGQTEAEAAYPVTIEGIFEKSPHLDRFTQTTVHDAGGSVLPAIASEVFLSHQKLKRSIPDAAAHALAALDDRTETFFNAASSVLGGDRELRSVFARELAAYYYRNYGKFIKDNKNPVIQLEDISVVTSELTGWTPLSNGAWKVAHLGVGLEEGIVSLSSLPAKRFQRLLLVDQNPFIGQVLTEYAKLTGYGNAEVVTADISSPALLEKIKDRDFDEVRLYRVLHEVGRTVEGPGESGSNREKTMKIMEPDAVQARQRLYRNLAALVSDKGRITIAEVQGLWASDDLSAIQREITGLGVLRSCEQRKPDRSIKILSLAQSKIRTDTSTHKTPGATMIRSEMRQGEQPEPGEGLTGGVWGERKTIQQKLDLRIRDYLKPYENVLEEWRQRETNYGTAEGVRDAQRRLEAARADVDRLRKAMEGWGGNDLGKRFRSLDGGGARTTLRDDQQQAVEMVSREAGNFGLDLHFDPANVIFVERGSFLYLLLRFREPETKGLYLADDISGESFYVIDDALRGTGGICGTLVHEVIHGRFHEGQLKTPQNLQAAHFILNEAMTEELAIRQMVRHFKFNSEDAVRRSLLICMGAMVGAGGPIGYVLLVRSLEDRLRKSFATADKAILRFLEEGDDTMLRQAFPVLWPAFAHITAELLGHHLLDISLTGFRHIFSAARTRSNHEKMIMELVHILAVFEGALIDFDSEVFHELLGSKLKKAKRGELSPLSELVAEAERLRREEIKEDFGLEGEALSDFLKDPQNRRMFFPETDLSMIQRDIDRMTPPEFKKSGSRSEVRLKPVASSTPQSAGEVVRRSEVRQEQPDEPSFELVRLVEESDILTSFEKIAGMNNAKKLIALLNANSQGVMNIEDFAGKYGRGKVRNGYSLGLLTGQHLYKGLSRAFGLADGTTAHAEFEMKPAGEDHTARFLERIISTDKPIVFFVPDNMRNEKIARDPMNWIADGLDPGSSQYDPAKLRNIFFVFGAYRIYISENILKQYGKIPERDFDDKLIAHLIGALQRDAGDEAEKQLIECDVRENSRIYDSRKTAALQKISPAYKETLDRTLAYEWNMAQAEAAADPAAGVTKINNFVKILESLKRGEVVARGMQFEVLIGQVKYVIRSRSDGFLISSPGVGGRYRSLFLPKVEMPGLHEKTRRLLEELSADKPGEPSGPSARSEVRATPVVSSIPRAKTGLEALFGADRILKEKNAVGIVVGSMAAALWNPATTSTVLEKHDDLDVMVLSPRTRFEINEGGIDWWTPRERSLRLNGSEIPRKIRYWANAHDIFIRAGILPIDTTKLAPGLYLASAAFAADFTRQAALNSLHPGLATSGHALQVLDRDLERMYGRGARLAQCWTDHFGGKSRVLDSLRVDPGFDRAATFALLTSRGSTLKIKDDHHAGLVHKQVVPLNTHASLAETGYKISRDFFTNGSSFGQLISGILILRMIGTAYIVDPLIKALGIVLGARWIMTAGGAELKRHLRDILRRTPSAQAQLFSLLAWDNPVPFKDNPLYENIALEILKSGNGHISGILREKVLFALLEEANEYSPLMSKLIEPLSQVRGIVKRLERFMDLEARGYSRWNHFIKNVMRDVRNRQKRDRNLRRKEADARRQNATPAAQPVVALTLDGTVRSEVRAKPDVSNAPRLVSGVEIKEPAVIVIEKKRVEMMGRSELRQLMGFAAVNKEKLWLVVPDLIEGKESPFVEDLKTLGVRVSMDLPEAARNPKIRVIGFSDKEQDTAAAFSGRLTSRLAKGVTEYFALEGGEGIFLSLLVARPEDLPVKNGFRYDKTGRFRAELRAFVQNLVTNYFVISSAA